MKQVYIITKNSGKILAAKSVFSKFGIEVKNIEKEYFEIQAETSLEVAREMAIKASKEFKVPVIREFLRGQGESNPHQSLWRRSH